MLRALVTIVRPGLSARARATSVVVVPPVKPTTVTSPTTRSTAAAAMRRLTARWLPAP